MTTTRRWHSVMLALAGVVWLLTLGGCSDEDPISPAYTDYRLDIVTYQGQNDRGAVFERVGRNDSGSVVLQSTVDISADAHAGQRVLLRYGGVDMTSGGTGNIDVYACNAIVSDTLRRTAGGTPIGDYPMHEVRLRSLWRTGQYINLHCQVEYTGAARTLMLVADSATVASDTVHCYVVHDLRGQEGTYWRDCYASFYVGGVWQRSSCRVVRVHVKDLTYSDVSYYDFEKSNQ